jgi:hypothetical protein
MGQILHRSATTTEAIRRAIQHSQESLRTRGGMASTRRRWPSGGSAVQRQIVELVQRFPSPPSCPSSRRPSSLRFASTLCCRSMTVCTPCKPRFLS